MIWTARRKALAAALVAALVGLVGVLTTRGGDPDRVETTLTAPSSTGLTKTTKTKTTTTAKPKAATTTPPTSSRKAAGTTPAAPTPNGPAPAADGPAPRSGIGPYSVAAAKGPTVNVQLATPADVDDGAPKLDARPAFAGDQRATSPLPRLEQPVQGRFAVEGGYRFDNPQPFGDRLTFLVVRRSGDWLQVQLPVRPNGTMGWIKASDVETSEVTAHVEINLAERKLRIFDGASLVDEAAVAVGTDATRTPTGRHFLTDKLAEPGGSQKQPWSLGISAYSEQLDTFDGGAPQIAMHGWRDASVFGQARSNGCIRAPSELIDRLAGMPLGTPVDVYAS